MALRSARRVSPERLRITWRLLAIYFVALVVPLLSGGAIYLLQIRQVEAEIRETRSNTLALNKEIVESSILLVEEIITDLRQDTRIMALASLDDPLSSNSILHVADAFDESRLSRPTPDYLVDVQVYLTKPNLLFTLSDVFFDPGIYYRYFFTLNDWSYRRWMALMGASEYVHSRLEFASISLGGERHETIALYASLPYTTRIESVGTVAAYIDREQIEALLETYLAGSDGFAFIVFPDGRRLASAGAIADDFEISDPVGESGGSRAGRTVGAGAVTVEQIGGREYAVATIRSEANQWLYVAGTPVEVFFSQSRRVRGVFIALALLVLLVGLPIALLQSIGVSRRIARASEVLKHGVVLSDSISRDPFEFMSDSVDELIKRDRSLRELLDEQKPYVQRVVLDRLFRGQFESEAEAYAFLSHFDIHRNGSRCHVYCIIVEGYFDIVTPEILNEFTVKSALITDELERLLPPSSFIHNVSHNVIGIAVFVDDDNRDVDSGQNVHQIADTLAARLRVLHSVRCTIASGGVSDSLLGIHVALRTAIQRAENTEPGSVTTSEETEPVDTEYHYPTELEGQLIRTVRAGSVAEVQTITAEIAEQNLDRRVLSRESLRRLYHELDATRLKIERTDASQKKPKFAVESAWTATEGVRRLLSYFEVAAQMRADAASEGSGLREPIERFVQANALDPEMGLKLLALELNLSEVYVSRLFKEEFGENFHSYVENIRMDQAVRLLRSTRLNVAEIADRVGYQSGNTFRRVFKRRFGVAPSAFDRMKM